MKDIKDIAATNIKRLRLIEGLSQQQLAKKAKITDAYLSRIERHAQNITLDSLQAIARALGVPVVSLLEGEKPLLKKGDKAAATARSLRQAMEVLDTFARELEK